MNNNPSDQEPGRVSSLNIEAEGYRPDKGTGTTVPIIGTPPGPGGIGYVDVTVEAINYPKATKDNRLIIRWTNVSSATARVTVWAARVWRDEDKKVTYPVKPPNQAPVEVPINWSHYPLQVIEGLTPGEATITFDTIDFAEKNALVVFYIEVHEGNSWDEGACHLLIGDSG